MKPVKGEKNYFRTKSNRKFTKSDHNSYFPKLKNVLLDELTNASVSVYPMKLKNLGLMPLQNIKYAIDKKIWGYFDDKSIICHVTTTDLQVFYYYSTKHGIDKALKNLIDSNALIKIPDKIMDEYSAAQLS